MNAAAILSERGELSLTQLNYLEAARHFEEARKAVNVAFQVCMQAGQDHYRRYFEDRVREIDGQLAVH